MGKDKDDIFWTLGKIHGLENIALCDLEAIKATRGDPMKMQMLVNQANDDAKPAAPGSYENALKELQNNLIAYREAVEKIGGEKVLLASDKKKLLALPFYMSKR